MEEVGITTASKFWVIEDGKPVFTTEAVFQFLKEHGIGILDNKYLEYIKGVMFIKIEGKIVKPIKSDDIRSYLYRYIDSVYKFNTPEEKTTLLQKFAKDQIMFERKTLLLMEPIEVNELLDTKTTSYLFFKNCVLKVTKDGINRLSYDEIDGLVFEKEVIDYNLPEIDVLDTAIENIKNDEGEYLNFIYDVCGYNDEDHQEEALQNFDSLKSIMGYMLNRYKDPSIPLAVVLLDPTRGSNDESNGGSGKGILVKSLGKLRAFSPFNGKKLKASSQFCLQRVEYGDRLLMLEDMPRHFDFEDLYTFITDFMAIERKYNDEYIISPEASPKIIITANHVLKNSGGDSSKRRKVDFTLADYYGSKYSPDMKYGHNLFLDWEKDGIEWQNFYVLMAYFLYYYMVNGIKQSNKSVEERLLVEAVDPSFITYIDENIKPNIEYNKATIYGCFREYSNMDLLGITTFRNWLSLYAKAKGYKFNERHSMYDRFFTYTPINVEVETGQLTINPFKTADDDNN